MSKFDGRYDGELNRAQTAARLERMGNDPTLEVSERRAERNGLPVVFRRGELLIDTRDEPLIVDQLQRLGARRAEEVQRDRRRRTTQEKPSAARDLAPIVETMRRSFQIAWWFLPDGVSVESAVEELRSIDIGNNAVARVYPHYVMHPAPTDNDVGGIVPPEPVPPGAAAQDPPCQPDGCGVAVAILDTGILKDFASVHGFDVPRVDAARDEHDALYDTAGPPNLDDNAGHGTFIAGIVHREAPGAAILSRQVADPSGVWDEIDFLIDLTETFAICGPRYGHRLVINCSFGCQTLDDDYPILMKRAIDAVPHGVAIVACAGNLASTKAYFPAAFKRVIAVAACDTKGTPADFSNHSWWVDCRAVGVDVCSTYVPGKWDSPPGHNPPVSRNFPSSKPWASWSGTSFAAPYVAAAIARRMSTDASMSGMEAYRRLAAEADALTWLQYNSLVPTIAYDDYGIWIR